MSFLKSFLILVLFVLSHPKHFKLYCSMLMLVSILCWLKHFQKVHPCLYFYIFPCRKLSHKGTRGLAGQLGFWHTSFAIGPSVAEWSFTCMLGCNKNEPSFGGACIRSSSLSALVAYCGGLILAGCRCPPSHSIAPLLIRVGQEKIAPPHGWRQRQFNITKAKSVCRSKGKQRIYSLLLISKSCPDTSWEAGLQHA